MSYILDALKKSDQERQRGTTPTLHSAHSVAAPREPGRRLLYPTLALALAAVAFAVGWLRPWREDPMPAPVSEVAAVSGAASTAPMPPESPGEPSSRGETWRGETLRVETPRENKPREETARQATPRVAAPRESTPRVATPPEPSVATSAEPRAREQAPAPAASSREPPKVASIEPAGALSSTLPALETAVPPPSPRAAAPAAPNRGSAGSTGAPQDGKAANDKVPTLAELPASLRAELPAMAVTVHAYSPTPKERLLGVNNRLLREGDTLTPELVLERITPDGMIFSYKGTRFQRGLR